jgi:DNA end-binding protein Ku
VKAGQTKEITQPEKEERAASGGADVIDLMALLKKSVESKAKAANGDKHHAKRHARKRRAA